MVHFSSSGYNVIKPSVGTKVVYAFRYGDIKHLTPKQIESLIGGLAKGGETGGARVMHALESTIDTAKVEKGIFDTTEYLINGSSKVSRRVTVQ